MGNKKLLAYCGLYCSDCAGYSGEIVEAAKIFKNKLTKYKFERTAKYLFSKPLKDYNKFIKMLDFISDLKCSTICRDRKEEETTCTIRKCCIEKEYYACHECSDFEKCDKLQTMVGLHRDSCVKNLRAIKEMGVEKWITEAKRYWFGSDVDE
ncbi:MAG: DUF3795 domain-containing protein [candidate division WOR-3 bacterium]|nr:MAG: DUF3795 domain-containing protein [candidate division WOR-3 bacterium]